MVASWRERALRRALHGFVDACARQHDYKFDSMIDCFARVEELLADPGQVRTGTDIERRSLELVDLMRPVLSPFVGRTDDDVPPGVKEATTLAGSTVETVLMGEAAPWFDVVCWNEANAVAESVQRPYLAASMIRLESDHDGVVDRFGIVPPLFDLLVRYEDEPDTRDATAAEITAVLDDFRARAPWPIAT